MRLKPKDIKKYNKLSKKKPIMVRVGRNWYTWYEGDPKYGVFLTTQSGRDVEFDFKQIDDIQEGVEKLKSAFNEIYKGKVPKELHRGDTGEMLLTTETDGRGTRVEIVPSTIADAVRELK